MDLDRVSGSILRTEDSFGLTKIRVLNLRFPTVFIGRNMGYDPGENAYWFARQTLYLSEVQIYGEGYVPEVVLTSPFIEAGSTKALGQIWWERETPAGTGIEIQTRSGRDVKLVRRFFDKDGDEVTKQQWQALPFFLQGSVAIELQPTDWSVWSRPYKKPGEWVTSPTPSPFFQVRVRLLSGDPYTYPSIRSLSVDHFDPLVRQVAGEIVPCQVSQAGVDHTYSCLLRCVYDSENLGFDGIVLRCGYPVDMELLGVRRGTVEGFVSGNMVELAPGEFRLVPTGSDSIWIHFPSILKPVHHDVLEIQFGAKVFLQGTPFEAFLVNSERPGAYQRVRSGDAVHAAESDEMRVMVPVAQRVIGDVQVQPRVFSPNGDGRNDEVEIRFSVFNMEGTREVSVEIMDLGGRVVRGFPDLEGNGQHRVDWDGRDESGERMVPGIYMVLICVDADSRLMAEDRRVVRTVCVAY